MVSSLTRPRTLAFCLASLALACAPALAQDKRVAPAPPALPAPGAPAATGPAKTSTPPPHDYPYIALDHQATAQKVIASSNKFAKEVACKVCGGDGSVDVQTVEYPPQRGVIQKAVTRHHNERCGKCAGSGFASTPEYLRVATDLVRDLATLKPDDPRADEARQRATENIQAAMKGKETAAATFFDTASQRLTTDLPLKTGQPMLMIGKLLDDPATPGSESRLLHVGPIPGFPHVLVSEPQIVKAGKGERVIVGGIFAGRHQIRPNETVPVAQGGFVIVLP